ncbi:hypothetical protein FQR65_LT20041 [Abscondita terminalis]|nr:hypothetical protein FQR65_LT20041 [Abscondita terminalis]
MRRRSYALLRENWTPRAMARIIVQAPPPPKDWHAATTAIPKLKRALSKTIRPLVNRRSPQGVDWNSEDAVVFRHGGYGYELLPVNTEIDHAGISSKHKSCRRAGWQSPHTLTHWRPWHGYPWAARRRLICIDQSGGDAVIANSPFHGWRIGFSMGTPCMPNAWLQRLIAVGLGNRDVILETSRQRLVQIVHGAKHAVTGIDLVDDDTERIDVHDLVEGPTLATHLLVDAVQVFLAP